MPAVDVSSGTCGTDEAGILAAAHALRNNAKLPVEKHMFRTAITLIFLVVCQHALADGRSNVAINGYPLTQQELLVLEYQLGTRIAPGNYLVDPSNGCWANLSTGASGCPGGTYGAPDGSADVYSRYGSGGYDAQGNWNHYSNAAGGAVGGTADGCVYTTFGWSNC